MGLLIGGDYLQDIWKMLIFATSSSSYSCVRFFSLLLSLLPVFKFFVDENILLLNLHDD